MVAPAELERETKRVGRELADAFPSRARHPRRALDDKAMEAAAADAGVRAALFRLVDVTPACRSLDDLARHLTGYLDEVEGAHPSLDVAMRLAGSGPGRRALGAACAGTVRHMAHRFIAGESPSAARRSRPWPRSTRASRLNRASSATRRARSRGRTYR